MYIIRPAGRLLKNVSSITSVKSPKWMKSASFTTYQECLQNLPPTRITVLDNGLKVATEDKGAVPTATVGVWIHTGSRFETAENNGLTYFLEQMSYTGTNKRSEQDLDTELFSHGASLHSYTTPEETAFYVKCVEKDVPFAVEILSDVIQNKKFGDAEIEKVRGKILRELEGMEENNIRQVVFDLLHSVAYQETPLSQSIYGPSKNVKGFTKQDLLDYVNYHYKAPRMVLAGAGGVEHETLVRLAEEHFSALHGNYEGNVPEINNCRFTGSEVRWRDDAMPFCWTALALETVGPNHPDYIPLQLASLLVGSYDKTHGGAKHNASNLIRQTFKDNLCFGFESFNKAYRDTGLWGALYICEKMQIEDFSYHLQQEWVRLCMDLTEFEVERAKNMLITKLIHELDGGYHNIAKDIGQKVLHFGRRKPFLEIDADIRSTSAEEVQDAMYRNLYDKCPAMACVGPCEALPDYNWLRMRTKTLIL